MENGAIAAAVVVFSFLIIGLIITIRYAIINRRKIKEKR